jgi:hypothetical protein
MHLGLLDLRVTLRNCCNGGPLARWISTPSKPAATSLVAEREWYLMNQPKWAAGCDRPQSREPFRTPHAQLHAATNQSGWLPATEQRSVSKTHGLETGPDLFRKDFGFLPRGKVPAFRGTIIVDELWIGV